ncbi:MAG TPA: penicillin-binding transpeptidase domain-containing protein [Limnochordia bacterium]|nr:penicillin-binding transpeptidase domain-containing protein [Limnochordia bacterium]
MERGLRWALKGVVGFFFLLSLWMGYWCVIRAPYLSAHPQNPRLQLVESKIRRGGIYARGGEALSVTTETQSGFVRSFVGPLSAAHVVGYSHPRYGKAGLEAAWNRYLLGVAGGAWLTRAFYEAMGWGWSGWDAVTTLDARLQEAAAAALGGHRGALVALDPKDGAILAMVSQPGYDPARLAALFEGQAEEGALFNRATQGQYPPGSTFKIIVMAAALESGAIKPEELFDDRGSVTIDGRKIQNPNGEAHGPIAIDEALAYSSNAVFARLASELDPRALYDVAVRLGFGARPPLEIAAAAGRLPRPEELESAVARAEMGIGQGALLVTPLQMALATAAVANGGWRVEPRLLEGFRTSSGEWQPARPAQPERVLAPGTAQVIKQAMIAAATWGTAKEASRPGVVAGKTGTAENPHGKPHAWFVGFYPAHEPKVALAIVVENGGWAGQVAAPIARQFFAAVDALEF